MIAGDADRLDHADTKLARDNGGWHKTTACDADQSFKRPRFRQTPSQSARVSVKLIPGNRERLIIRI
jgi:hypothetical protein